MPNFPGNFPGKFPGKFPPKFPPKRKSTQFHRNFTAISPRRPNGRRFFLSFFFSLAKCHAPPWCVAWTQAILMGQIPCHSPHWHCCPPLGCPKPPGTRNSTNKGQKPPQTPFNANARAHTFNSWWSGAYPAWCSGWNTGQTCIAWDGKPQDWCPKFLGKFLGKFVRNFAHLRSSPRNSPGNSQGNCAWESMPGKFCQGIIRYSFLFLVCVCVCVQCPSFLQTRQHARKQWHWQWQEVFFIRVNVPPPCWPHPTHPANP